MLQCLTCCCCHTRFPHKAQTSGPFSVQSLLQVQPRTSKEFRQASIRVSQTFRKRSSLFPTSLGETSNEKEHACELQATLELPIHGKSPAAPFGLASIASVSEGSTHSMRTPGLASPQGTSQHKLAAGSLCDMWGALRRACCSAIQTHAFRLGIALCIVLNAVLLACEHNGQSQSLTRTVEVANIVFATIFSAEMLIKVAGLGVVAFMLELGNVCDAAIVIASIVEVTTASTGVSVLRAFRLLRLVGLIQFLPSMRKQLSVLMRTLDSVLPFLLLLFLFIFIFAIIAMNLFGGSTPPCPPGAFGAVVLCRERFSDFFWSFTTVFQASLERWSVHLCKAAHSTPLRHRF